jgi:hypothetical protein
MLASGYALLAKKASEATSLAKGQTPGCQLQLRDTKELQLQSFSQLPCPDSRPQGAARYYSILCKTIT